MALLHNLFKIYNIFFPFFDTIYILQIEEYSNKRLLLWLSRFFFRRNIQKRERLILTKKVLILAVISHFLFFLWILAVILLLNRNSIVLALTLMLSILCVPYFVFCANALFSLAEIRPKKARLHAAAQKIKKVIPKVIAIAGSYGKTSTKNFIFQLVKSIYRTQMIPGNINTPLGIANWVLSSLQSNTELLIAEVDAYEIGEIKRSCMVIPANIAILTNVGDQHLERFGNRTSLAQALSEVFNYSASHSIHICDQSTKEIITPYYTETTKLIEPVPLPKKYTGQLSESNQKNLQFALTVAQELKIPEEIIDSAVKTLSLPERRQEVTRLFGFEAVDDSYNISYTTASAGIKAAKTLAQQRNKKLLVITAGIPELAPNEQDKNKELGELLSKNADFTIVLKSMFAPEITKGFTNKEQYLISPTLNYTIQSILLNYDPEKWVLLLQPELNDLYY